MTSLFESTLDDSGRFPGSRQAEPPVRISRFRARSGPGAHVAVAIGGDRKAAILCMISANNARGIATSAI